MPRFIDIDGGTPIAAASDARDAIDAAQRTTFNVKDYGAVGNGIANDGTPIAAAIAAANSAGGGIVFLPTGTYLVTAALTVSGNNITVQGAGRSATIIKTVGNHIIISGTNASGLTVRDLQVLGDADVAKTSQRGIQWTGVTNGLIHNVWAKNTGYDGILLLSGCVDCTISNCRVSGCQDDGINIGGDPSAATTGTVVSGCVITDCLHVGVHISDRSSFSSVTGNTISGCEKGIDTYQASYSGLGNNTITGNTIRGCSLYGVYIFNSDFNTVSSNSIEGSTVAIKMASSSSCVISSNVVKDPTTNGYDDDGFCSDVVICDNLFSGATAGVFLESPRSQVSGNSIRGAAASVLVNATADYSVISSNVITNGTGNNIEIQAQDCVVSGNFLDSGTKSIATSGSSPRCTITGNLITGGQRGIECASTDCLISGNQLTAQTVFGIYAAAIARTQIVGNHITSAQVAINMFGTTDTYIADNVTVSTVGTNSITENATSTGTILAHNRLDKAASLLGTTPVQITLTPTTTYTATNVTTDRSFDANATTVEELGDVLGTLIADLKTKGIIAS